MPQKRAQLKGIGRHYRLGNPDVRGANDPGEKVQFLGGGLGQGGGVRYTY